MIEVSILSQLREAAAALAGGIFIGLFADFLKSLRGGSESRIIIALSDILLCALASAVFFLTGYSIGSGRQRIFVMLLIAAAVVIYRSLLSRAIYPILSCCSDFLLRLLKISAYPLIAVKKICKKFLIFLKKLFKKCFVWYRINSINNGRADATNEIQKGKYCYDPHCGNDMHLRNRNAVSSEQKNKRR